MSKSKQGDDVADNDNEMIIILTQTWFFSVLQYLSCALPHEKSNTGFLFDFNI